MSPSPTDLIYLLYLLPGFLIYAIVYRLLIVEERKDAFEITFLSLFLSLLVYLPLSFLDNKGIISLEILNWKFFFVLFILIILITILSILFMKYCLPSLEKFTQKFDFVKLSSKDILSDILDDKINKEQDLIKKQGVWLAICTTNNEIYTGYVKRQGFFSENKKGIYLKNVIKLDTTPNKYKIEEFEGILFLENQIKWISIIKNKVS